MQHPDADSPQKDIFAASGDGKLHALPPAQKETAIELSLNG